MISRSAARYCRVSKESHHELIRVFAAGSKCVRLTALAQAQGFTATIYWYDDGLGAAEPPITMRHRRHSRFADGAASVQIYWITTATDLTPMIRSRTVGEDAGEVNSISLCLMGIGRVRPGYFHGIRVLVRRRDAGAAI